MNPLIDLRVKSFVLHYGRLNSCRMHYVQTYYLVSTFTYHTEGGGVGLSISKWGRERPKCIDGFRFAALSVTMTSRSRTLWGGGTFLVVGRFGGPQSRPSEQIRWDLLRHIRSTNDSDNE